MHLRFAAAVALTADYTPPGAPGVPNTDGLAVHADLGGGHGDDEQGEHLAADVVVLEGEGRQEDVPSMPGIRRRSVDLLLEHGVPCGPIYAMDQVFADPQIVHSGIAKKVASPVRCEIEIVGLIAEFDDAHWLVLGLESSRKPRRN